MAQTTHAFLLVLHLDASVDKADLAEHLIGVRVEGTNAHVVAVQIDSALYIEEVIG